jgi:hypothetical protein
LHFNFKNSTQKIKDNLSLIILIPTILGGFWQLYELINIKTSFIRFFSITQVIPDGLLILFILLILYGILKIVAFFNNKKEISFNQILQKPKHLLKDIIFMILRIIIIGISIYIIINLSNLALTNTSLFIFIINAILSLITFSILIYTLYHLVEILIKYTKFGTLVYKNKSNENNLNIIFGVVIFLIFFYFLNLTTPIFFRKFKSEFILPEKLKNIEYVECEIKEIYSKDVNYKILYLNDKYIFVKVNNDEILIIKLEKLLTYKSCE